MKKPLLFLGIASSLFAQKTPRPEDYPVNESFTGAPAAPKFATPGQRLFRTVIREGAKKGPNFAGHFAIVEWGCGTECVLMAVVDLRTGDVYDGPFGEPRKSVVCVGSSDDQAPIIYNVKSSLLTIRACPNEGKCGTYYYNWKGTQFKLVQQVPIASPSGCSP